MGAFFAAASKRNVVEDVYYGTDYHSHLGTRRAGMAAWDERDGLQREIHSIESSPFRTRFGHVLTEMRGCSAIGCISDGNPQPLLIRSEQGSFAIAIVGRINNGKALAEKCLKEKGHFAALGGGQVNDTELVAALICQKPTLVEGIRFAQQQVEGTLNILLLLEGGHLLAARDLRGRLPVCVGRGEDMMCVSFEDFAYGKLGCETLKELEAGEIVELSPEGCEVRMQGFREMHICSFLWTYYGYPTSSYQGVGVESMRYRNGEIMARHDMAEGRCEMVDHVGGVPDSGTPHALGYAYASGKRFARAFIKYTPTWSRSFMPAVQSERNHVARMKQIPVNSLIRDRNLLFVDDSIVRGTQLRETVEFLYESGARSVHIRSACPPIMYGCKFLNFSRNTSDMELITRQVVRELEGEEGFRYLDEYARPDTERGRAMRERMCGRFHLASLEFQTLEGLEEAIGLEECRLCTYCWTGRD